MDRSFTLANTVSYSEFHEHTPPDSSSDENEKSEQREEIIDGIVLSYT